MSAPHNIVVGDKVIVTCDNWFFAPDGLSYRAVFGTVKAIRTAEDSLGVRPNGKSTNWYLEVGNMTIAGCQIHYLVRTLTCNLGRVMREQLHEGRYTSSTSACEIYDADEVTA